MSHFVRVGIFCIDLNRTDLVCWRLTLSLARPSLVLDSPAQLVWFHFGAKACARPSLALAADTWSKLKIQLCIFVILPRGVTPINWDTGCAIF